MVWEPSSNILIHSAKGSTWKNHKYLKKIGNAYIYAKTAAKHKKESDKYTKKQFREYEKAGLATADAVSSRMGHPDYNIRTGKDDEKAMKIAYKHGEMATRYRDAEWKHGKIADRYERLAKEELSSIPKEMIDDGKRKVSSIKNKIKKLKKNKAAKKAAKKAVKAAQKAGKRRTKYEKSRR